jgi:DNA-binding PadR family transcriptional regulator
MSNGNGDGNLALSPGYICNGYILSALYSAGMSRVNNPATVTQAGFLVLLALAIDEAHGYAVMQFAEEATGGRVRLPPGTLYRTISRLLAAGLVEEIEGEHPDAPHDARRRYYRLTGTGRRAAEDEVELLARLFRAASRAGLAGRATNGGVGDAGLGVDSAAETPQEVAPEFPPRIREGLGVSRTSEGLPRMTMGPWRRRPKATFRREGEYWSIAFHSDAFRLRDSKGLHYLSVLLAAPGREFHSLELVVSAGGHAGRGDMAPPSSAPAPATPARSWMNASRPSTDIGYVISSPSSPRPRTGTTPSELHGCKRRSTFWPVSSAPRSA